MRPWKNGDDPCATARRAIVRAAAEVEKSLSTTILYIFDKDGRYCKQWWVNFSKHVWDFSDGYPEYYENRNSILKEYTATYENHYGVDFLEFQSEEDVTLFLLKFS